MNCNDDPNAVTLAFQNGYNGVYIEAGVCDITSDFPANSGNKLMIIQGTGPSAGLTISKRVMGVSDSSLYLSDLSVETHFLGIVGGFMKLNNVAMDCSYQPDEIAFQVKATTLIIENSTIRLF